MMSIEADRSAYKMPCKLHKQQDLSGTLDVAEAFEIFPDDVKFALFLDDEELEDLKNESLEFTETATSSRYSVSRRIIEKGDNYLTNHFFAENDEIFRKTVRMGKDTFRIPVEEIQGHSIFQTRSYSQQSTPAHQSIVALER